MRPFLLSRSRPDHSVLAGVAPFDRYRARDLGPLARHADRLRVPPGAVLARAGRPAHEVVAVVRGEVTVLTAHGVERHGPGAWVGAAEVLDGTRHPATVVAGDGTEVVVLTAPSFRWAAQVLPGLVAGVRGPAPGDGPRPREAAGHAEVQPTVG